MHGHEDPNDSYGKRFQQLSMVRMLKLRVCIEGLKRTFDLFSTESADVNVN
jgi:hypothetical protein